MKYNCPTPSRLVKESVVRITSFFVFLYASFAFFVPDVLLISILFFDFLIRALPIKQKGLFGFAANQFDGLFFSEPKYTNGDSKRFAAMLGTILSGFALLFVLIGAIVTAKVVLFFLAVLSFLEFGFGYCLGCTIHALIPSKIKC